MNYSKQFLQLVGQLVFLSAVLFATACSNKESTFIPAPEDADNGSIVYFYRPSSSTNFMMSPKVVIDDNEKFNIGSGSYRYIYLQSGKHMVGLKPADQYITDAPFPLTVEVNKSHYLRVKTSLQFEPGKMNTRKFHLEEVAEKQALNEIAGTAYSGPLMQQTAVDQNKEHENKEGFSVDKTQDPFAGKQ